MLANPLRLAKVQMIWHWNEAGMKMVAVPQG